MSPSICRPPDNPYEITIEEAEQTLMQIMQSMASTKSTESIERKITDRYSIGRHSSNATKSNDDVPYIHVFNFENEAGFAIMSADKRVTPLLSYALKGNFEKNKEIDNPGLATYMSLLEEYVDNVIAIDTMQLRLDTIDWYYAGIPDFAVMINGYCPVKWGQEYPYNYYCPTEDGQNTLTGCVATAVAQLMCTYRYPDSYNGYEFNWQEMIDSKKIIEGTARFDGRTYFLGEPDAGMHQIARLMQQLGLPENLDMNYGKHGSGAYMKSILRTLENFGYAKGAILTLTVVFDTRQAYRLAISQNAYPHITVTLNDDPFYTIENDTLYVGVAVEIGEDVADMRLAVICDYNMDIPGFKDYFINCSSIFDGKVFTMENYLKERDEYGVFYLTMSSRYFDIPNLCIAYMALDETGEYSFNYVMLSEAGD